MELTARKRNRVFSYAGYIDIMNRGTELPDRKVRLASRQALTP